MSGYGNPFERKKMKEQGISAFIDKPFKLADISNIIHNLISKD